MDTSTAFPLTAAGLIAGFTHRIMAFLILRVRGLAVDTLPPVTRENCARVLAFGERLTRFTEQATRLAELALAGTLRVVRPRSDVQRPRSSGGARAPRVMSAGVRLPNKFGWMLEFVTPEFRDDWAVRLTNGSMVVMLRTSPSFARHLRWFTRGMGFEAGPGVFPPLPPRARPARRAAQGGADPCPAATQDAAPEPASEFSTRAAVGPAADTPVAEAPQEAEPPVAANPFSAAAILASGGSLGIAEPYYLGNPATAPVAATVVPVHVGERSWAEKLREIDEVIARGAQLRPPRERVWYWRREI